MPYTAAPGFRMYYEEHGSGFPLLLINGLGSDHLEWLHQVPAFAARFRGIVFDNRGTGETDVPPGPYTTAEMADDAASLLRTLGIGRAHVLGVSLGGMIAQEVALRHPDLVDGLVLGCTGPGGSSPSGRPRRRWRRSPSRRVRTGKRSCAGCSRFSTPTRASASGPGRSRGSSGGDLNTRRRRRGTSRSCPPR